MRHFAHNIGDYAAATRHLSFVEDAAYRRLLDRYYQDEKPLPTDPVLVCRLVGATTRQERSSVLKILAEFFTCDDTGYHQKRADREIATYKEKVGIARANGTKGGRPPNQRNNQEESGRVISEKLTTPHSPVKKEDGSAVQTPGAREDDGDDEPIGQDEPEVMPPIPKFLLRQGVQPMQAQRIAPDWLPSENAQRELTKARPDLTPERIGQRMTAFRRWCAETNKHSHNPDQTWLGFMEKTHVEKRTDDDEWSSPATRGIDAAFARRFPGAG